MILSKFYESILQRLLAKEVPLEYFDVWNDQIERNADEEDTLFFNYPAIFIEFEPVEFETLGRRKQHGELNFNLIVASESLHETANIESILERSKGFEHLQILDAVFASLQGFNKEFEDGSGFGSITRTKFQYDHASSGDQIISHEMPFKCRLVDVAAMPTFQKIENTAFCNTPGLTTGE